MISGMFSKIKLIALSVHNSKDVEYIAKHAMYRWGDDDFPMVRVAVAMHPLTPMNTLELMAADDNSEVISAIISNCKTSKRILKKIVQKNIPFWSKIAKTRLTIRRIIATNATTKNAYINLFLKIGNKSDCIVFNTMAQVSFQVS